MLVLAVAPGPSSAAQSTDTLSGNYRLHFEQTTKSCGQKIPPLDVDVAFEFSRSNVSMKFPSGFLGISLLDVKFNPGTGIFKDQLMKRSAWAPYRPTFL
jgi:hypothetical protein